MVTVWFVADELCERVEWGARVDKGLRYIYILVARVCDGTVWKVEGASRECSTGWCCSCSTTDHDACYAC